MLGNVLFTAPAFVRDDTKGLGEVDPLLVRSGIVGTVPVVAATVGGIAYATVGSVGALAVPVVTARVGAIVAGTVGAVVAATAQSVGAITLVPWARRRLILLFETLLGLRIHHGLHLCVLLLLHKLHHLLMTLHPCLLLPRHG
jgi:hypothetical protein